MVGIVYNTVRAAVRWLGAAVLVGAAGYWVHHSVGGMPFLSDGAIKLTQGQTLRHELRKNLSQSQFNAIVSALVNAGDLRTSELYARLADKSGYGLTEENTANLAQLQNRWMPSGCSPDRLELVESISIAVTCSKTASIPAVSDITDFAFEASRMLRGQDADSIQLFMSGANVTLTAASFLDVVGLTPKVIQHAQDGIKLTKLARGGGFTLQKQFIEDIKKACVEIFTEDAVRAVYEELNLLKKKPEELLQVDINGAFRRFVGALKHSRLISSMQEAGEMHLNMGDNRDIADTYIILTFADSLSDISDLAAMTDQFKDDTRGIIEVTGKTSPDQFKGMYTPGEFAEEFWQETWLLVIATIGSLVWIIYWRPRKVKHS